MKTKVFIVIPVYNRWEYTKRCLKGIGKQTYKDIETIVIDDGSSDGTFAYIRRYHPQVHVIRGDGSLWWTKATSLGIDYALGGAKDSDYILLLNNDCFVGPEYIKQILRTAQKYPKTMIGSFCVTTSKPTRVVEVGVRIHWPTGIVYSIAEAISDNPRYYRNMEVIDQLDALPGKGTLVPVKLIKKMGNVNYQRLPHYIADYEFSNRAKRFGYELLVDVKAMVKHHWEATGYKSVDDRRLSYKEAWNLLFGKKSMNNIVDWCNFLFLACPKQYLKTNLYAAFWRLINGAFRVYPLTLVRDLWMILYRLILKIKQFPKYYLRLWFYRLIIKIKQFPRYYLGWK